MNASQPHLLGQPQFYIKSPSCEINSVQTKRWSSCKHMKASNYLKILIQIIISRGVRVVYKCDHHKAEGAFWQHSNAIECFDTSCGSALMEVIPVLIKPGTHFLICWIIWLAISQIISIFLVGVMPLFDSCGWLLSRSLLKFVGNYAHNWDLHRISLRGSHRSSEQFFTDF